MGCDPGRSFGVEGEVLHGLDVIADFVEERFERCFQLVDTWVVVVGLLAAYFGCIGARRFRRSGRFGLRLLASIVARTGLCRGSPF